MKFRHEQFFAATPSEVVAMRIDPSFRDHVAAASGVNNSETTVTVAGETTEVVVEEQRPVQGIPAFAKKIVGDTAHIFVRESWKGTAGTFEFDAPGKPMRIVGSISVAADNGGSVVVFDLEATASIPLIGGKLEKLASELTQAGLEVEQHVGDEWLAKP